MVEHHLPVHPPLDLAQLLCGDGLVVAEVEPRLPLVHQRTLLLDVVAENLAQREVQEVRRGVVPHDVTAGQADFQSRTLIQFEVPVGDVAGVENCTLYPRRLLDGEHAGRSADHARVADLPALLGVEVGAVQEHSQLTIGGRDLRDIPDEGVASEEMSNPPA